LFSSQGAAMAEVLVFVHYFRLGTQIADVLATFEYAADFPETTDTLISSITDKTRLIILDLDDPQVEATDFVAQIRSESRELPIAGFMAQIRKGDHDKAKAAGCHWIFTRSSFVQNLKSLLSHGLPEQE
jgi:CheY-like chemotaxis protein